MFGLSYLFTIFKVRHVPQSVECLRIFSEYLLTSLCDKYLWTRSAWRTRGVRRWTTQSQFKPPGTWLLGVCRVRAPGQSLQRGKFLNTLPSLNEFYSLLIHIMASILTVKELLEFLKNNNISEDAVIKVHSWNNEWLLNPVIEAKGRVVEDEEYKEEILILEYVE